MFVAAFVMYVQLAGQHIGVVSASFTSHNSRLFLYVSDCIRMVLKWKLHMQDNRFFSQTHNASARTHAPTIRISAYACQNKLNEYGNMALLTRQIEINFIASLYAKQLRAVVNSKTKNGLTNTIHFMLLTFYGAHPFCSLERALKFSFIKFSIFSCFLFRWLINLLHKFFFIFFSKFIVQVLCILFLP